MEIREVTDWGTCREIWQAVVPPEHLFDLWETRACFARHYEGQPCFLVASRAGETCGLLPLARTNTSGGWGFFPGETWMGKTWLERNRIIADDRDVCRALLDRCPPDTHLRYLSATALGDGELPVDETGYLFVPGEWDYSAETFWAAFSGKSRRRNRKEMEALTSRGMVIRRDAMEDIDMLFELNLRSFGDHSYFADARFQQGFRDLIVRLAERDYLGITTVLVEGTVAAVDVNAVYRNASTVLAGGTHPDFPGVAKVINHAHIEWACEQKYAEVDFLCGDFGWKQRFHLTPRPLHQYRSPSRTGAPAITRETGCSHGA